MAWSAYQQRVLRAKAEAKGLCRTCMHAPRAPDRMQCDRCLKLAKKRNREYRERNRNVVPKPKPRAAREPERVRPREPVVTGGPLVVFMERQRERLRREVLGVSK